MFNANSVVKQEGQMLERLKLRIKGESEEYGRRVRKMERERIKYAKEQWQIEKRKEGSLR